MLTTVAGRAGSRGVGCEESSKLALLLCRRALKAVNRCWTWMSESHTG